MNGRLYLH